MTQERIDSTKVGNGRFRLKGRVESPKRYLLEVNANPAGTPAQDLDVEQIFLTAFYLGNSKITVSADTETMQTLYWQQGREEQPPLVEGSVQEDLHRQLGGGWTPRCPGDKRGRQQKLPALSVLPESHSGISPAGHQRTMIWSVDVG